MDQEKQVSESEFRNLFVAQMHIIIDLMVTVGTVTSVLGADLLPVGQMETARKIVENLPKTKELRKLVDEIRGSASTLEFLRKFQGTVQ